MSASRFVNLLPTTTVLLYRAQHGESDADIAEQAVEPILFLIAVLTVSFGCFWLLGLLYGLIHRPSIYFPPSLALKMSLGAIFGSFILGFGGVVLATWLLNYEFQKRSDYRRANSIIAGLVISVIGSVVTLMAFYGLGWQIFG